MPKIFLLKNRLQEQQARLLESQKGTERSDVGELDKPVALIVTKKSDTITLKDNCQPGNNSVRAFLNICFKIITITM